MGIIDMAKQGYNTLKYNQLQEKLINIEASLLKLEQSHVTDIKFLSNNIVENVNTLVYEYMKVFKLGVKTAEEQASLNILNFVDLEVYEGLKEKYLKLLKEYEDFSNKTESTLKETLDKDENLRKLVVLKERYDKLHLALCDSNLNETKLRGNLESLTGDIEKLEAEIKRLNEELENTSQSKSRFQTEINELKQENSKLNTQLHVKDSDIFQLRDKLSELTKSMQSKYLEFDKMISELNGTVITKNEEIKELTQLKNKETITLRNLNQKTAKELNELKLNYSKLENDFYSELEYSERNRLEMNKKIEELTSSNQILTKTKSDLERQVNKFNNDNIEMLANLEKYVIKVQRLTNEFNNLASDNAVLLKKLASKNNELSKLEMESSKFEQITSENNKLLESLKILCEVHSVFYESLNVFIREAGFSYQTTFSTPSEASLEEVYSYAKSLQSNLDKIRQDCKIPMKVYSDLQKKLDDSIVNRSKLETEVMHKDTLLAEDTAIISNLTNLNKQYKEKLEKQDSLDNIESSPLMKTMPRGCFIHYPYATDSIYYALLKKNRDKIDGMVRNDQVLKFKATVTSTLVKNNLTLLVASYFNNVVITFKPKSFEGFNKFKLEFNKTAKEFEKFGERQGFTLNETFVNLCRNEINLLQQYNIERQLNGEIRKFQQYTKKGKKKKSSGMSSVQTDFYSFNTDALLQSMRDELNLLKTQRLYNNVVDGLDSTITNLKRFIESIEKTGEIPKLTERPEEGCVYIVSNEGSFGKDVYKIGMTKRSEDPTKRIDELYTAGVPFKFNTHCILKTDNAFGLESALHRYLGEYRLNFDSYGKEFFKVPNKEILIEAIHNCYGKEFEFADVEASDFMRSNIKRQYRKNCEDY